MTPQDIDQIKAVVVEVIEEKTSGMEQRLTQRIANIEKNTRKIRSDLKTVTNYFDREDLDLLRRVERLEKHLGLSSAN